MKKRWLNIINFFLFFSLTVVVVYLVFKGIPWEDFTHKLLDANYFYVIISGVSGLIAFYFRGVRWRLMLEPLGYKPPNKDMLNAVAVGYLANMAIPRFGEVVRCAALNKTNKVPVDQSFGTVITERLVDLIVLFVLLFFVFIFKINFFGRFFDEKVFIPLGSKFSDYGYLLILIVFFTFLGMIVFYVLYKKFPENKMIHWIKDKIWGMKNGFISILKMEKKWEFLFHTFMIWFFYFIMAYIVFFAIPQTKDLTPIDALFVLVAGSFGMVAPVQNGFGAYHWIVSLALMMYGLTKEDGLLFATLLHETQVLMILIVGPFAAYFVFIKKRKTVADEKI